LIRRKELGAYIQMSSNISGLYKQVFLTSSDRRTKRIELELRVDVDGKRPMNIVSGDFFSNSGRICDYLGSFRFEEVKTVTTRKNEIVINGKAGKFDPDSNNFTQIRITITLNSTPLLASVQWISSSGIKSTCLCEFKSKFFRRVQLENDFEEGVEPFKSYNTNSLPSPLSHRLHPLTVAEAYAEAGIEIVVEKKKSNTVAHPKRFPLQGSIWTDNELHAAMIEHFSMLKDQPQWAVWLLSATEYEISDVKGVMLEYNGKQRKACAVFHRASGWESNREKRMQLFVYVHELGHCFNLTHPWDRAKSSFPLGNNKYDSLSWMNYPWRYYSSTQSYGSEAFWKSFNFRFADSELIHLRHGFRNDVIFGGRDFRENTHSR
jgi:hypothetical protein